MKIYFIDCSSGISGDMFVGALLDIGLSFGYLKAELKKLGLNGYSIKEETVKKDRVKSKKFTVLDHGKNDFRSYKTIKRLIDDSDLNERIKSISKHILYILANAESKVHKISIEEVKFHEIGAIDTIIDIVSAAIGVCKLEMDEMYCSDVNLGGGKIRFSHGVFDVPAPATKIILNSFKVYKKGLIELTTPTGAAILRALCIQKDMIYLKKKVGYGSGSLNLDVLNAVKLIEGEKMGIIEEKNDLIETNIDNMNPEIYDYVIQKLWINNALDVFLTPIQMKKNRPATKLSVLCSKEDTGKMIEILLSETTTLGVRISEIRKIMAKKEFKKVKTKYGVVNIKVSKVGNRILNMMPEYEDCKKIAIKYKIPLKVVYNEALRYVSKE